MLGLLSHRSDFQLQHIVSFYWLVGNLGTGKWLCRVMTFFRSCFFREILLRTLLKNSKKNVISEKKVELSRDAQGFSCVSVNNGTVEAQEKEKQV